MFSKILIANRGEIAVRIIRACKEMGVATVAVYSEADKNALHVALADQSYCIGGPEASESYLNENQIISAAILARRSGNSSRVMVFCLKTRILPGLCRKNGLVFIGPDPESMERLSDKASTERAHPQNRAFCYSRHKGGGISGRSQKSGRENRLSRYAQSLCRRRRTRHPADTVVG